HPPPLSEIDSVECNHNLTPVAYADFLILESTQDAQHGERFVPISPDVSTCDDCLRELFDPSDRRYRYPFINCTNCGPRFTIIEDIPYDRANTTMREFEMCAACLGEYRNPLDRRFHAEPIACPACGPQVVLVGADQFGHPAKREEGLDVVNQARSLLLEGDILAIKG